eukprot:gene20616-22651_t
MAQMLCKWILLPLFALAQVKADLTINVQPSKIFILKGQPVKIDCTVTGARTTPVVTWNYKSLTLQNSSDVTIFPNNTLYIKSLTKYYRGDYSCAAKTVDADKYVVVNVDWPVLRKLPQIPNDYELIQGTVNITCLKPSRANPPPTIAWEFNGKPLIKDSRYSIQSWSLIISNLQQKDSGNYTCVVENMAGVRRQTMKLQVYVANRVEVSPKSPTVVQDKSVYFDCKSFSSPPFPSANIRWSRVFKGRDNKEIDLSTAQGMAFFNRHTIFPNGTLKITGLEKSDEGDYECRFVMEKFTSFYRDIASLKVFAYVKLNSRVHQNHQNLDRILKKPHAIHCSYTGDGPITVAWSKVGLATLPARMKPAGNTLTISDLKSTDSGKYYCKIEGKYNTVTASVDVLVYEGPQFVIKPKNITVKEGESGQTVCKGKAIPKAKTSWVRADVSANENLPPNFKIVKNETLVVKKAKKSNAGGYFCVLANGYTSTSVTFYVNVKDSDGGTGGVKGGQQSMGRTVGIAVGCAGAYIVLVIGLMIYCRRRRARLLKKQGNPTIEIEDGEFNKDLLGNGDDEYGLNGDLKNLDKWKIPREALQQLAVLGHGKLGKVCTAKAQETCDGSEGVLVCVKHLEKQDEESKEAFDRELDMLTQLRHDNVIKLLGICINDQPSLIITEYSEEGILRDCLNRMSNLNASAKLRMCSQIASGMEYLSANGIIHQDLACRNCLVVSKDFDVKVAFFSLNEDTYASDYYIHRDAHVPLRWLSPEALFDENYSEKSGVWAFGVVVWEIHSLGKRPYPDKSDEDVVKRLRKNLKLGTIDGCPHEVNALIANCCRINPDERPKFSEIVPTIAEIPVDSNV